MKEFGVRVFEVIMTVGLVYLMYLDWQLTRNSDSPLEQKMAKVLDTTQANEVSKAVQELYDELGYSADEFVPGLIQAIIDIAPDEQYLDEAADLLADGGVDDD